MKACSYCGKQYPDEAVVCSIDGQSLDGPTESRQKTSGESVARVLCPACGASDGYTPTVELRGSFSWPIFLAGGFLAVLFRNAGRSRRVRCNKCEAIFNVRTPVSKLSLVIFWLLICPTIIALIIFLVALVGSIISH